MSSADVQRKLEPIMRTSDRKLARIENKKRKLKAFLDLVNQQPSEDLEECTRTEGEEALKKIRKYAIKGTQLAMERPKFWLLKKGLEAKVNGDGPPLACDDVQSLILSSIMPKPRLSRPPDFCELLRSFKASKVAIYLLNNVPVPFTADEEELFSAVLRFDPGENWLNEVMLVELNSSQLKKHSKLVKQASVQKEKKNFTPVSKTDLLLSESQMARDNYPSLPSDSSSHKRLRKKYRPATDESPLFAIDCEMCLTIRKKQELTRVSVVDENLEILMDTLVKPDYPIINYLTRYSGITEKMMKDVQVSLKDVQKQMKKLIPRDAILCGHSLNFDLHALELYHPHVIDTSVIYNLSGFPYMKSGLKKLALEFLGETIQDSDEGHCSVEDARTALKLVKLKLKEGLEFGNRAFGAPDMANVLPLGKYAELKEQELSVFYDYCNVEGIDKFACVLEVPQGDLKEQIIKSLSTDKCICIVVSNMDKLCRIRV